MKLAKCFVPAFAMMAIALGCIAARAAEPKVKIGVAMSNFDDVWLTYVRDAITKWANAHPDVQVTIVDGSDDTAKQVGQVDFRIYETKTESRHGGWRPRSLHRWSSPHGAAVGWKD